jgi:hypothetical protein
MRLVAGFGRGTRRGGRTAPTYFVRCDRRKPGQLSTETQICWVFPNPGSTQARERSANRSVSELLGQDALIPRVTGVEEQGRRRRATRAPSPDLTDLISVWSAAALTGRLPSSSTSKRTVDAVRDQRAAPTPWPERADRRQRQKRRVERQDRAVRGEVVGGGARRRRDHDAVADQFLQPHLARRR